MATPSIAREMDERRPLSRMNAEKYKPHTVKMPDSLFARFRAQSLFEGETNVTVFIRSCAFTELERRERERSFGVYRGKPGMPAVANGMPAGSTGGFPR